VCKILFYPRAICVTCGGRKGKAKRATAFKRQMNLGFWEIVVIGLVLFLLYGENFPNIARKIGKTFLQIKKMWEEETKNFQ
jgi:hypothetical protein